MAEATSSKHDGSDVCLMLVGKSGHGRTATINSIAGRKIFKVSPAFESVTQYAQIATTTIDGRLVKVVDTPGLANTRLDEAECAEAAMEGFNRGVSLCSDGFDALVLVYIFGERLTNKEITAIEKLKEMFGENVIQEYGILLFTYGDNFDEEEVEMNFKECYLSAKGSMNEIIKECNNRCVLFDNKTKDKAKLSRQRDELLRCVDGLQSKGKRYTSWVFEEAKASWKILAKQKKYPIVIKEGTTVLGDISHDLVAAQERGDEITDEFFNGLRKKLHDLRGLIANMEEPEKRKWEDQIKEMDGRILFLQNKEEEDKTRQEKLKELCTQNEALKRQHREQVEQFQKDYEKLQKDYSDEITAAMEESGRIEMEMFHRRRSVNSLKRKECVIA